MSGHVAKLMSTAMVTRPCCDVNQAQSRAAYNHARQ
jgi:hypothetical protein